MYTLEFKPESLPSIAVALMLPVGIGLVVALLFCLEVADLRALRKNWIRWLCAPALAGITGVQILGWHLYFASASHTEIHASGFWTAILAGGIVWISASQELRQKLNMTSRWIPLLFSFLAFIQSISLAKASELFAVPNLDELSSSLFSKPQEIASGTLALTDEGNEIRLFTRNAASVDVVRIRTYLHENEKHAALRAIRRREPELETNCHGWVFTAGQFIVRGADVSRILVENHYRKVSNPEENDVVAYFVGKDIVHTAIVRGVLSDGSVLVEGKWGIGGTFLHLVDEQPYSEKFVYYRTGRGSNQLEVAPLLSQSSTITASN